MELYSEDDDDLSVHQAALNGDFSTLRQLCSQSSDFLERIAKPFNCTPLRLAVTGGDLDCVRFLLGLGADVETVDIKGQTPVFVAASMGKPVILKELLDAGGSAEGSRKNRATPLLVAVLDGRIECVKILLEAKAVTEPSNSLMCYGVSGWALHHSIVYAHFHCFLALIQAGALVNLDHMAQIDATVVARLSVPHAVLRYASTKPEFLRLYYECGGKLDQVGASGKTANKDYYASSLSLIQLRRLASCPMSLKSNCRLQIRRKIPRDNIKDINDMRLPATLISYLKYRDFEPYATCTIENNHRKCEPLICEP